jgi:hypothetical protein
MTPDKPGRIDASSPAEQCRSAMHDAAHALVAQSLPLIGAGVVPRYGQQFFWCRCRRKPSRNISGSVYHIVFRLRRVTGLTGAPG